MTNSQFLLLPAFALFIGLTLSAEIRGSELQPSKSILSEGIQGLEQYLSTLEERVDEADISPRPARAALPFTFFGQKEKDVETPMTSSGVTKVSPLTMRARIESLSPEEVIRRMYHRPMYDDLILRQLRSGSNNKKKRSSYTVGFSGPMSEFIMRNMRSQAETNGAPYHLPSAFYADAIMRQL